MHASAFLVALSTAATASASALGLRAAPENAIALEKRADVTAAWVSVDNEGQPETTYTPSATVVDGTTSIKNGAPHDITASVYTMTEWGKITTSTGSPPNPTATSKTGQGAFARCYNSDGDHAPICEPAADSTLFVGSTYYVTWDPDYFNNSVAEKANTTYDVSVRLDYFNTTSLTLIKEEHFDLVNASWGYFPFYVDKKYLHGYSEHNFTLTLYSQLSGHSSKTNVSAIWVQMAKQKLPKNEDTPSLTGHTLTIALPTVFGAIILLLVGGCLWNRKTRRIDLGNVMGRRRGYNGRKTRRLFRKDNGIQLDTGAPGQGEYRDMPPRPRRDSNDLDSLANSPIDGSFHQQGTSGGRNAFRDELARQDRERR